MMNQVLIQSTVTFFAVFGLIELVRKLVARFLVQKDESGRFIVLTVKDQQDTVEALIRSCVFQSLARSRGSEVPKILVVDMGSVDETPNILSRLENEYSFIYVTDKAGYLDCLSSFINND